MPQTFSVSGTLTEKEVRRTLARRNSQTIGPTTVYYAGVTAPIIATGMSLFSRSSLERAGYDPYYTLLLSAMIAAMTGICWYFLFTRLAWKRTYGRETEIQDPTTVTLLQDAIRVDHGGVQITVGRRAIDGVSLAADHIRLAIRGHSDLVLPLRWFDNRNEAEAFVRRAEELADKGQSPCEPDAPTPQAMPQASASSVLAS